MFRQTTRCWQFLLQASVRVILSKYGITGGVLVVDDSEKKRTKQTTRIYQAHQVKDHKSGGFMNGQHVVFLLLVTGQVTIPVGVELYMPDPQRTAWKKEEPRLKKQGMCKKNRPAKPRKNPNYPTIPESALRVLKAFRTAFPE